LSQSLIFAQLHFGEISVVATTRFGGNSSEPFSSLNLAVHVGDDESAVLKNRDLLSQLLQADALKVLAAAHGADLQFIDSKSTVRPGDGFVTKSKNLGLVALAADCAVFALVDPVAEIVAVGHCGWQGLVAQLPRALTREFAAHGGNPNRSIAVIGPTICAHCYEVPPERVELVAQKCQSAVLDETHLDIAGGVRQQLSEFGFQIEQISACTKESNALYSYRRDGLTGRHALAVVIHGREN
jgi:YfiH family protein